MVRKLMVQGVTSGAGKTTLTAALCRHLASGGTDVAPFKAQNVSLNSFVTADGREMAISQAYQAWACGLEPSADTTAPSRTRIDRSTSTVKSTCPGVSIMLI